MKNLFLKLPPFNLLPMTRTVGIGAGVIKDHILRTVDLTGAGYALREMVLNKTGAAA